MIYIENLGKNEPLFGKYALTEVTQIEGTEAFLGLDESIKKCQTRQTFQECQSQKYKAYGLEECNCTPYEMRNYNKTVSYVSYFSEVLSFSAGDFVYASWLRMLQISGEAFRQMHSLQRYLSSCRKG